MLNETRIQVKPFVALTAINLIYLLLLLLNSIEGIFALWIVFLFLSLLPLIIKERRNIVAIIIILIPLEVTKTLIPFFQLVEAKDGMFNSIFDLARLFMLFSFIVWFLTDLKTFVPVVKSRITYILGIFIAYYFLSTILISPDTAKGLTESFRYLIYFLFFIMIIQFIKKEEDFTLIWKSLTIIMFILSIEGIFEYIFDYYLWYDNGRRASATFLDPNIFARFLVISMITLLILRLKKIKIFKQQYMDIMILLNGIGLLLTVSRQGLALFFLMILFISFFMNKRQRLVIISAIAILALIAIPIFIQLMAARERGLGLYDIGQRTGLLLGAALMFISSPIFGVGAGAFQITMISKYFDFLPWGLGSDTLSHTYVLTILAEQGLIGFSIFIVFLIFVYKQFRINYNTENPTQKAYSLIIFSAILAIFISAQAEARFFEEPLLWLFLGLHVALGRLQKSNQEGTQERRKL